MPVNPPSLYILDRAMIFIKDKVNDDSAPST
jgi:hypothetical protein